MKKLLIIGFVWPEPVSTAAGSRMIQLIRLLKEDKWSITFATTAAPTGFEFDLDSIGVRTKKIELNNASFDLFVKELNPWAVLFDRFMVEEQFGWRVAEQCPNAIRILDTEDLHFLRKGREAAFKSGREAQQRDLLNDHFKREVASMYRCDLSLIISSVEYDLLIRDFDFPEYLIHCIPFLQQSISNEDRKNVKQFEERDGFMTIGNFLHTPNLDSVVFLKEAIWPLIKEKLPTATIKIYGAYGYEKAQRLHDISSGFFVKGRAEDVSKVMQEARVCIAPLRFGAGLKGKFIDAMNNGTPIVTTKVGAEGMFMKDNWSVILANEPKAIAEAAVLLHENKVEWQKNKDLGFEIINDQFTIDGHKSHFIEILDHLLNNLKEVREQNIVGQLLSHHQLQSTKYMAKWIEEKNKTK